MGSWCRSLAVLLRPGGSAPSSRSVSGAAWWRIWPEPPGGRDTAWGSQLCACRAPPVHQPTLCVLGDSPVWAEGGLRDVGLRGERSAELGQEDWAQDEFRTDLPPGPFPHGLPPSDPPLVGAASGVSPSDGRIQNPWITP